MNESLEILTNLIKRFEGLHRLDKVNDLVYPYVCPAGYATQGWGLRVASMDVSAISLEEADQRLKNVLGFYIDKTIKLVPTVADDERKLAAVVDFCFNLGPTALAGSTFRKRLNEQDWEAAASECQRWVFGGGRKLPGLVRRRAAEASLIKGGE